ncbi:amino acid adenylation domain-containing protein [Umezawaea endophytica]|uniref:Amino acid adenylation domain-containing protein n=1 Tax=Umezawaea endophytica TaxID=1654476 RepID=A0A9X2VI09_9PSEU|nr:amino acid adenylation domain-containing protein [Umezawaea endophytica]MCS7477025.1 amino acid adenylation domain-containing protein [Umezawaea endophytica]
MNRAATLPELFRAQVARTPDALALRFEEREHSYARLDARTDRLARVLVSHGVGPERIVAVVLPRSDHLVLAVLAVAKAGGAFLPIDSRHPADRVRSIIADARPVLTVTSENIDALMDATADDPLPGTPRVDQLAYAIYTSGTTGGPKGVLTTHAGIEGLTGAQGDAFEVGPGSRVLQFASPSFDALIAELCVTLLRGATLVVAPQRRLEPGAALAELIAAERITHATLPPALLPLQEGRDGLPADLAIIVTGETCPPDVVARWSRDRLMLNAYGPTETTVCATMARLFPGAEISNIGSMVAETAAHVLDGKLRPVPDGEPGDLYLTGPGLARGYLGQPALTSGRYVADPFGAPGSRMYRTGDLACRRADGSLLFLGRADDQIKVRGNRVEPAEVEQVLAEHPDVTQARVVLRRDDGDPRLVAYVVPADVGGIQTPVLRKLVATRLPDYMVPAAFVPVEKLPMTTNGKLDLKALPVPRFVAGTTGTAPRTPQEETLCQLFADLLALPRVGIDDNFFELGGDSLLATRLSARVRATLGLECPVHSIVEAGTPAGVAARLGVDSTEAALAPVLPLRAAGRRPPVFCVHPAGGISWSYAGLLPQVDGRHPVYGLQAHGLTGTEPVVRDLDEMVGNYLAAIREVQPRGPYHLLGWSFGGLVAHALAARIQLDGDRVGLLALLDAYPVVPPDLLRGNDEAALLADLAHFVNLPADTDRPLDRAAVLELARREGSALASLDAATIERVIDVFAANHELTRTYAPRTVRGDLHFFTATRDRRAGLAATDWRAFVEGEVHEHEVDCTHQDMGQVKPMAHIGAVIAAVLPPSKSSAAEPER